MTQEPQVTLNPVPIPQQPDLSGMIGTQCLEMQTPINDLDYLALHVAQLTGVVQLLLNEVERLKNGPGSNQD